MTKINVAEAKACLSGLIDRVLRGERVVISRRNRALVRLTPVRAGVGRRLGWARGGAELAEDFDLTPEDFTKYISAARRQDERVDE
jgi:prevent-host-death family protein